MYVAGRIRKDGAKPCVICKSYTLVRVWSPKYHRMIPVCRGDMSKVIHDG